MPDTLTRRDFLRIGALTAASAVVSGCTLNLQRTEYLESYVKPPEAALPGENLWYATTCRQCSAGCGVIVRVSNGRALKVEGNPLHPVNGGKLCARGQAALQELYDPDRLPGAVRQAGRGSRAFTPLSWEEALGLLAQRLQEADPAQVAFLGGNLASHLVDIVGRFLQAVGGRPLLHYTLGDELEGRSSLVQFSKTFLGTPALPYFDIANAGVIFSFGANFLETWLSPVHYSRAYSRLRRGELGQRGYLVQFEPRMSSTAACADEWVPIHPGTEGLVALALARVIADTSGGASPAEVDLDEVAAASGVAVAELERLGRILASAARPLAIPGAGLTAHHNASAALAAIHSLNGTLGRVGQPGGVYLPPAGWPGVGTLPLSSFADIQALTADMAAGRLQVLFIHGSNPLFELPQSADFSSALSRVPLVVCFSPVVDETAARADLVLPDHTNLESWGYHVPPLADRTAVSGLQPVVPALHDTRATADVFLALAQALGGAVAQALPWSNEVDYLKEVTANWRDPALSVEGSWSAWRRQGGRWSENAELGPPAAAAAPAGLVVPAPTFGAEAEYPFHLHLFPSITLFDGRGANKAWLQETPDPMTTVAWQTWVEVHPEAAQNAGISDGDLVRVVSPAGEVEAIACISPGIHPGVVALPVGRGHEHGGRYATWGHGSNPMRLLPAEVVRESGALAWGTTRVRLEHTGRRRALARLESPEGAAHLREQE
jgi:anaerobic selenocysteine-containing dehydrogenase